MCFIIAKDSALPKVEAATHFLSDSVSPSLTSLFDDVPLVEESGSIPKAYLNASQLEWRASLGRMSCIAMVSLGDGARFDPALSAGAFAHRKPTGALRLICDKRRQNRTEVLHGHVNLPSAARFSRVLLPKTHVALVTLRDLKTCTLCLIWPVLTNKLGDPGSPPLGSTSWMT